MLNLLRNILAVLMLALPNFSRGKRADNTEAKPVEQDDVRLVRGGALEAINKHYGTTVAGGLDSQKIGDTFDALPEKVKQQFYAARKGRIIRGDLEAAGEDVCGDRASMRRISRGLNNYFVARGR